MASPRPGQRQVAPPLKGRRGTVGTLEEVKLAAAKRSAAAAEDSLASLAGRHDDSHHQVSLVLTAYSDITETQGSHSTGQQEH